MNISKRFTRLIGNLVLFIFLTLSSSSFAQSFNTYLIKFTDKDGVKDAKSTLSTKALDRRKKFDITLDFNDLPVSTEYINKIISDTSIHIRYSLKWHNGIVVNTRNSSLDQLKSNSFVKSIHYIGQTNMVNAVPRPEFHTPKLKLKNSKMDASSLKPEDYGFSYEQVNQIGVTYLHSLGYSGEGIDIAIFDAGFKKLDQIPGFVRHQANNKLTIGYDIAYLDNILTDSDNHGTSCASCFGAYDPGRYIGSSPLAHLFLFRTENGKTEYPIEELNWCKAAELADSAGVDMITSSLGYNQFDDSTLSYTHKDLNGKTSFVSTGAKVAVEKGILVLNSAGNSGDNKWRKIGTPADVPTVLTIGAVATDGKIGKFSSQGYNADGVVKPDVGACGVLTYVGSPNGTYKQGYGTSYSTPLAAGGVACLIQAFPNLKPAEINQLIRSTSSQAQSPDSFIGYGVANFGVAYDLQMLKKSQNQLPKILKIDSNQVIVYNSGYKKLIFDIYSTSKFLGLFNIKKRIAKGSQSNLQEVSFIKFNKKAPDCTKKYTIKIILKSSVGNHRLINNDLELCSF